MEGEVDPDVILDYVIFNIISRSNRFEASICSNEKTEKVTSGLLDVLELHLPLARASSSDSSYHFKLELPEGLKGSSWFTKSTLTWFLHIFNMPDLLKKMSAIWSELNQLEDTKKFHLTVHTKSKQSNFGDFTAESRFLNKVETNQNDELEKGSSDSSRNKLLRALDSRVAALNQELANMFTRALGNNCSKVQLSNLTAFVEHFGSSELRDSLGKYFRLQFHGELADTPHDYSELLSHDLRNHVEERIVDKSTSNSQTECKNATYSSISPAKIAQAERQSSSESDKSSDSSEEIQSFVERSRPAIRSASPRRSASPLRRIQIGRSGPRRSTALTIKSLSYFPAREKPSFNRDDNENNSGDESSEAQPKRSENACLRMSVQDRINLFESKQRDKTSDTQKKNLTTESTFGAKKSVLRRWSVGMGDSSTLHAHENTSDGKAQPSSNNSEITQDKSHAEEAFDIEKPNHEQVETAADVLSQEVQDTSSTSVSIPTTTDTPHFEATHNRSATSAEWNRRKEAELNQMLMKMMESKPAGAGWAHESGEQKGNFHNSHYKVKRDPKLRLESANKQTEKETKSKVMRGRVNNKKTFVSPKVASAGGKHDSSAYSQKTRRNSSPPVMEKVSSPNPVTARKASPKAPAVTAGRNSCPSIPSPRTAGTPPSKTSSGMTNNTKMNHRKPQSTPSPTQATARTERPRQLKGTRSSVTENKNNLKAKNETKPKTMAKSSKSIKTKSTNPPRDDSGASPAKPSLYSKVTKKSSVVPLEPKPFLRKGTGIASGVDPVSAKIKSVQPDEPSKDVVNVIQTEKESSFEAVEKMNEHQEEDSTQLPSDGINLDDPVDADLVSEKTQASEPSATEMVQTENIIAQSIEIPAISIHADDESGISSSAWVEVDSVGDPAPLGGDLPNTATYADAMPALISSPRVRHSLSQMLQAESIEPEIIEWGNAEIPPALVYQKDAPRGLKRLLKFARKNKGESNMNDYLSASVKSDGEEDTEEPRMINKRNIDASLKKAAVKPKGTGIHRNMLSESYDCGNSSKGSANHLSNREFLSASMNGLPSGTHKLREGRTSAASSSSAKGTRSFFSLSNFRSNKSSEAKLR